MISAGDGMIGSDLEIRIRAPSATRTRDLLLRRTLHHLPRPANAQVTDSSNGSRVTVIEREWRGRVARAWHAYDSGQSGSAWC
jgi:hypothetical protein